MYLSINPIYAQKGYGCGVQLLSTKFDCKEALQNGLHLFGKRFNLANIGFLYYLTSFTWLALAVIHEQITFYYTLLAYISLPLLATAIWLFVYQLKHFKKKCLYCFGVQLVIVIESFHYLTNGQISWRQAVGYLPVQFIAALCLITCTTFLIWGMLFMILHMPKQLIQQRKKLKGFESMPAISQQLYASGRPIRAPQHAFEWVIVRGVPARDVLLVLSLNCPYCYDKLKQLYNICRRFDCTLRVKVTANTNDSKAMHWLQQHLIISEADPEFFYDALLNWYDETGNKRKKKKNHTSKVNEATKKFLAGTHTFMEQNEVTSLPAVFIKNKYYNTDLQFDYLDKIIAYMAVNDASKKLADSKVIAKSSQHTPTVNN